MKLVTFRRNGQPDAGHRIGAVVGEGVAAGVVDFLEAAPDLPRDMVGLLEAGPDALAKARQASVNPNANGKPIPLADVAFAAPILRPPKMLGIGLNYSDHIAEAGLEPPKYPTVFNKQSTCVVGPGADVHLPRASQVLDYEGELGFVIGRRCRHVSAEDAPDVIAGYLIVNDVTVRDWQLRVPTWTIGKSFDTHGPIGPWIVTSDELGDPHQLRLRTFINDELRQDSNTKYLIFDCYALVEHLSTSFTLEPGDIVATGTPGGVGIAQKPPQLLKAGDSMRIEIEGLGQLENTVVDEPAASAFID